MKNTKALFQEIVSSIKIQDNPQEIEAIVYIILESLLGISKTDVFANKPIDLTPGLASSLQQTIQRINQDEPVQYVMGEEFFYGRRFKVNRSVLIPRPETEELIRVVMDEKQREDQISKHSLKILDIGTGSGCIPITLFHEISPAEVHASDVSQEALMVAALNAENLHAKIHFFQHDILKDPMPLHNLDIVVSNPPYVTKKEMGHMNRNVIDHEPHLALFVPDEDPLIFYKSIVSKSKQVLKPNGLLAVEINEKFGSEVSQLFFEQGYKKINIIKDVQRKDRIVKGRNN